MSETEEIPMDRTLRKSRRLYELEVLMKEVAWKRQDLDKEFESLKAQYETLRDEAVIQ